MANTKKIRQEYLDELKKAGEKAEKIGFALGKSIVTIQNWAYYKNHLFLTPVNIGALIILFNLASEDELFEPETETEKVGN